jgi:hypothetical protein
MSRLNSCSRESDRLKLVTLVGPGPEANLSGEGLRGA